MRAVLFHVPTLDLPILAGAACLTGSGVSGRLPAAIATRRADLPDAGSHGRVISFCFFALSLECEYTLSCST